MRSNGAHRQWRNKAGAMGACAPAARFGGWNFDILFDTMTQIAHNHGKCKGKVGKNIKMS